MSSKGTRERVLPLIMEYPPQYSDYSDPPKGPPTRQVLFNGKQITVSESHPMNRDTGSYDAGGPFYTSRVTGFVNPGHVRGATRIAPIRFYSGPVWCKFPTSTEIKELGGLTMDYGSKNESKLLGDGTTAISLSNPVNPASKLGTTLAEIHREGIPSLPGIKLWKGRTAALKAAGDEYLNYEFGWHPLVSEVKEVRDAARRHRDIMKQYHRDEGRDVRRRFDFPLQESRQSITYPGQYTTEPIGSAYHPLDGTPGPKRTVTKVSVTKKWFEGCFTYALPSSTDSWRKAYGFGSQADQLFGLTLTPSVLWELTPWSWAIDWFSNAGDVINNVTNIGAAGSVLRYGYMMEESIDSITAEQGDSPFKGYDPLKKQVKGLAWSSPSSSGYEVVTKRRVPASPFGFSIGWEGLSPTQLAITAALGITRLP